MTAAKKLTPATRADLDALPSTWRGEILDGTLYAFPRPRAIHAHVEGQAYSELDAPFRRGRGGPGGWWILIEPGIELPRASELSPDLAGWRRERLPRLPNDAPITVVPDWIGEVLSKSTRSYDLVTKRRFYAEIGVSHLWYIEPIARTVSVSRLENGKWLELGTFGEHDRMRAEPFDAIEIELAGWFEGLDDPADADD